MDDKKKRGQELLERLSPDAKDRLKDLMKQIVAEHGAVKSEITPTTADTNKSKAKP